MNEQAIQDSYNVFVKQGYTKSIDDYKKLISTNQNALQDSYNAFVSEGYGKSIEDYKGLMGLSAQPELKKKESSITELPSEDTSLVSQKPLPDYLRRGQGLAERGFKYPSFGGVVAANEVYPMPEAQVPVKKEKLLKNLGAFEESMDRNAYLDNIGTRALSGLTSAEKMVASLPEAVINIASIPQNTLAWATGWDIAGDAKSFKKQFGISNPILDKLNQEEKILQETTAKFNKERYESTGIVDNIQKGNYQDAFELLGSNIVESAPVSIAMMMGGATLTPVELAAISTAGFLEQNREQLGEENPDMSEIEKTVKALGMSAAETVFSAIGTGTIGQVYKDIIKKEGVEVGKNIFRDGLVAAYKGALAKYGAPIGLLGEGIEEAATQITQNVLSNKPAFEGVADAFVTGAGSGVVFTAPITAIKARDKIRDIAETSQSKNAIITVLKDNELNQVYNVPKDSPITAEQLEIANTNKSRDILSKDLSKKVKDGTISEDEAKQSLYVFDKIQQVSNAVKDLKVNNDEKAQIATLLRRRVELATDIQNKDDVLVVKEKQEIDTINKQIQDIIMASKPQVEAAVIEAPEVTAQRTARIAELEALVAPDSELSITSPEWSKAADELQTLKKEQDAIQKQTTDEGLLRGQRPEVGLQQVVEGDQEPQVITTGAEEVTPEIRTQEVVSLGGLTEKNGEFNGTLKNLVSISTDNLTPLNEDEEMIAWNNKNKAKKENNWTDKQWAESILDVPSSEDPISATLQPDGKIVVTDGHHRLLAAKILKKDLAVNLKVNKYTNKKGRPTISEYLTQIGTKEITIAQPEVSLKTPESTFAKNISVLITPATVRAFSPITKKIKALSLKYDKLVKQFAKNKNPKTLEQIKQAESEILDAAKQEIIDAVADIKGVEVTFKDTKRGLWDGKFEPSFNMNLTISPDADTKKVSDLLYDFAEKYSQDAFILETESDFEQDVISGKRGVPLTEFDENNLMHYPQIVYTFAEQITDEQVADLSVALENEGIDAFNINNNEVQVSVIKFLSPEEEANLTKEEQYEERERDLDSKSIATEKAAADVLGLDVTYNPTVRIKKSSYQGATNEGSKDQTRQYNRSNVLEAFQKPSEKVEKAEPTPVAKEVTAEPAVVEAEPTLIIEEAEQFVPMKASDIKTDSFTKDNAIDYIEEEKDTDSGRTVTYISSLTVEARNADGDVIGAIRKITDEDKMFYFEADDIDGNEINLDGYETLGEAKQALAEKNNKIQKKEFDKEQKKIAKEKAKAEAKKAKAKAKVAPAVEEQVAGVLDDLLALDPNDKTTLEKISNGIDKVIKDIDKFEKENLGVNIALPVMKAILKAIKALVDAGVILQDAIKRVAKDNNVSSRDVVDGINAISQITPIQAEYDALMSKADELISRQKRRNIEESKIVSNLDTFIRNSDVYKNANDSQKKIIEREARTKMGIAPKRAVSIGRVLGALKDITNITRAEKMLVIKQIRDLSRDAAKELAKEIREMASKSKITSVQAANIISRFGKVNMLNEISVSNFVDYMAKVFSNAEYANKIEVAKSKLKTARRNILTKIGIADGLVGPLQRLFSINPTLIPDASLERYLELVDMFGARQAVLTLDEKSAITKEVEAILQEIDNEQSKAAELADRFNASENKVYKDDELDYDASIKKMLEEKEIDDKEASAMRKYKEDITPQVEETELTEEEADQEKNELISLLKNSTVDGSELTTQDERKLAKEIASLIKTDALEKLSNAELKNLLKVIDNINNNYLPHYAQLMVEKMNAINNGKILSNSISKGKIAKFSGLYSRIKSLITKKGAIVEMIRRNPLFNIDQLFGDFKTKDIFNSVLNKAAEGEAKFSAEIKKVQNILEKAEEKVAKSFGLNSNETLMSKFKMMTYMIQLEYESNQGNKEVNQAADYLKATIKHIDAGKSQFGERDAEMLQKILKDFAPDGNIDNDKLYKSFNQAEKDAIKDIRGVNESLREKAEYTAAIIRGDRINPLNNYVHLNVLHEHQPNDLTSGSAFITEYNDSMRPSTKAKSLISRTGKVSPLNFDIFASAQRGAKFVLMDYNLTEPIRTSRKTINGAIANLQENADKKARNEAKKKGVKDVSQITGRIPKEQREIINAINSAFEEAIENLLTNTYVSTSIADDVIDYINKQGYRAILAGTGRFVSELSSNVGFALITDPNAFITGTKYKDIIMSTDAPNVMENVNSKQTNRIFPTDTLSGKLIDTSILKQASGIKGGKAKNIVANKIQQIYNLSVKKYVNLVELSADALISTPDKIIMRPMWFGSFANQFKKETGQDVDFDKIAANDEQYMEDNKEAIEKAKTIADERSVFTGATDNAFMGILKGTSKPNQSASLRAFNNFNNFMTRFLIFEYVTARTGIMAAIGNGSLNKKQGVAILAGVTTRMMVYTLLTQMLGTGLMGLFLDDEEPETEKSFMQKLGQAFASAFTSLTLGRDFGNATKMMVNYGLERTNEEYLDFLREGDYDPYKDAIQYSIVPPEKKGKQRDLSDFLLNMGGAFGPALKTADFITRKALEPEKKQEDAIERRKKELNIRIPLEVLGNAGLVPLYKDVRKTVMKYIYKGLEKAEENAADKKEVKLEKLGKYSTEGDMKRYDEELWNKTFGPDAPDYDANQAIKQLEKAKDSVERAMKDEMYNYTPKPKGQKLGLKKLY